MSDRLQGDPATRRGAMIDIAEWVKESCLMFGATPSTAYEVAAIFLRGLEKLEETKEQS